MASFQKMILVAALIILIVILIVITVSLSSAKDENWPPIVPSCPDYWTTRGQGDKSVCVNTKDLGVCPPKQGMDHLVMNFNVNPFTGSGGTCEKYKWANKCKVAWDGINYGVISSC